MSFSLSSCFYIYVYVYIHALRLLIKSNITSSFGPWGTIHHYVKPKILQISILAEVWHIASLWQTSWFFWAVCCLGATCLPLCCSSQLLRWYIVGAVQHKHSYCWFHRAGSAAAGGNWRCAPDHFQLVQQSRAVRRVVLQRTADSTWCLI